MKCLQPGAIDRKTAVNINVFTTSIDGFQLKIKHIKVGAVNERDRSLERFFLQEILEIVRATAVSFDPQGRQS